MSGGVDSSVAAALLLEQGHAVEGVTMKLTAGLCCDIGSAQEVCRQLGIAHRVLDLQEAFERTVVADFVDQYRAGRTPNPCIRCNEIIKFERLLSRARTGGFDRLATGHYARIARDPDGHPVLARGTDPDKDQSYFLYRLSREQLSSVLFPLGTFCKSDVRRLAAERGLHAAERPESQEICFIPGDDYRSFLRQRAPGAVRPGKMVLTDGTVVGSHDGVAFFTVGQRRGLGVAAGERLYVVRIDPGEDRVVLGRREELASVELRLAEMRYAAGSAPSAPFRAEVRIRYRAAPVPATVHPAADGRARVVLDVPAAGVSPGQAAVLYDRDLVTGGGIIEP